jgi:hypothetical protein
MTIDLETDLTAALAAPMTAEQLAGLDRRMRARSSAPTLRPRLLPSRRWVALLAVAALTVASTFAFVSATTPTTESPQGLASADAFRKEIQAAEAVVPIPAGATWPPTLDVVDGHSYSAGGGRSLVESRAFCMWTGAWLDAQSSNDAGAARASATVIARVPTWEMYRGRFATQSYRDVLDVVITAVGAAKPSPVASFRRLNC